MPDNAMGTVAEATPGAATAQVDAGKASEQTPYLATYRTREDAEHGLAEKEDTIRRLQSERDKAQNIKEILATLAPALKQEPTRPAVNAEAEIEALAQKIEAGGGRAVVDALMNVQADMDRVAEEKATAKTKAVMEELVAIREKLLEVSPAYRNVDQNKVVEIQAKYGVSREQAYKIAADIAPRVVTPQGPPRAGTSTGAAVAESGEARLDESEFTILAGLVGGKPLTEAEKTYLNIKHAGKRR